MKTLSASLAVAVSLITPCFAENITRLDAEDLAVQTTKWVGKTIEAKAFCFYADKADFRCLFHVGGARIDFTELQPTEAQEYIENTCGTLKQAASEKCHFTLRFVYERFDVQESGSNDGGRLTMITAKDNKAIIVRK